jgi:DNA-binding MarR family transcriptional regulator
MSFSFKRAEDSPGFLLWQLTNEWQRKQRLALAALDLTHVQFVVLACLLWLSTHSEEVVTQQKIAEFANIDKMMVSTVIKSLIQKKFLSRLDNPNDSRAYALSLTAVGRKKVLAAIPIVEGIDAEFFTAKTTGLVGLNQILNRLLKSR